MLAPAPPLTIEAKSHVVLAPQLTRLKASQLGPELALPKAQCHEVLAAVEMIFRGL